MDHSMRSRVLAHFRPEHIDQVPEELRGAAFVKVIGFKERDGMPCCKVIDPSGNKHVVPREALKVMA